MLNHRIFLYFPWHIFRVVQDIRLARYPEFLIPGWPDNRPEKLSEHKTVLKNKMITISGKKMLDIRRTDIRQNQYPVQPYILVCFQTF